MANTGLSAALATRRTASSGDGYAGMMSLVNQPTMQERTAQSLLDATSDVPNNSAGGALVRGLANGYGIATSRKEGKKRDRMTEYLLAEQQYQMDRARWADETMQQVQMLKTAQESRSIIQNNIDLSLDAYQSTGDLGMLNETLQNQNAGPFRKLFENQISGQGGVYQGVTATPEGDLMPYGVRPDGTRVYGNAIPVEQGYSAAYLTAKQATQLEQRKAEAEIQMREAQAANFTSQADNRGNGGASSKPLPQGALKLQDEAMTSLNSLNGLNADIDGLTAMIDNGELDTGLLSRAGASVRTQLNSSTQADRNLSTLDSKLEGLRNGILLMAKGVQTNEDALRAFNEIVKNKNDTALVRQRLQDIRVQNERNATLQQLRIDSIRNEYGKEPMDYSSMQNQPSAVGTGQAPAQSRENLKAKYGLE